MRVAAREDWRDRRSVAFMRATGEREPSSEWLDTTRTVRDTSRGGIQFPIENRAV